MGTHDGQSRRARDIPHTFLPTYTWDQSSIILQHTCDNLSIADGVFRLWCLGTGLSCCHKGYKCKWANHFFLFCLSECTKFQWTVWIINTCGRLTVMNEIFCVAVRENPRNLYPTDDIGPTNCQPWQIDIDIYVRSKKTVDRWTYGSVSSLELRPIIPMQSVLPRIYEPMLPMLQWTLLTVRYPFWVFMHRLWPSSIGIGPVEVGTDLMMEGLPSHYATPSTEG